MKRFAFIDVQNTETTALKVLKFAVDHQRLFEFLKTSWHCEKVFFYPGMQYDDIAREEVFAELTKLGAIVRVKHYSIYKNDDKIISTNCPQCTTEVTQRIEMGYSWKCNCDVELTADVLDCAGKDTEIFLFSGDGDFEFLIQKVIAVGAKVTIVASAKRQQKGTRYLASRLSLKLKKLTEESGSPVRLLELDNIKLKIRKGSQKLP